MDCFVQQVLLLEYIEWHYGYSDSQLNIDWGGVVDLDKLEYFFGLSENLLRRYIFSCLGIDIASQNHQLYDQVYVDVLFVRRMDQRAVKLNAVTQHQVNL